MKQRISMVIDQEIVRLAKKRAAEEQRTLRGLIQEVLVRHLRKEAATPNERKIAYQLFCERPMQMPPDQLRYVLEEDV